ncbi:ATP-binding protein [Paenibacillus validus]|uniref:histidine kinase n=1 Tax=Paenibacillus chartarius TaxID=747481 RepID=A0ABV6DLN1_9BACL|nr:MULTISPECIES: ATP-binding protein [Paenibacillus]MED4600056.1 ATP-binding protein [Paenibacillus validus]MED4605677.1 ATP-binding protein [Paenibacillus validus]NTZ20706.1 HAMP domain-containing protein [Paenibacillus sp. JMULE4]SMF25399.1 two-component system, OmpR family, sensor histidine kinase BaeS [Paenibacillus barengoltzii]
MHIKHWMFWRKRLTMKLIMVNGLVIAVVIWLAGVSVKDFACMVVGQYELVGEEKSRFFNETMEFYLWRASFLAILVAAIIHYVFIKKILSPLKRLAKSTQLMIEGHYPEPIEPKSHDEIGQLTKHFNELAKTLKRTEENRKRLLSNISHELRTPLSNLNGYLEALSNGVIEGNRELYQSLLEESQHLTRLVEQLHHLTVWEARGNNSLYQTEIKIHELLQQTIQAFQLESDKAGVSLDVSIQEGVVLGEEDGIKQVMNNLLKNAFMYNTGNEIKITGKREQKQYRITVSNMGESIPGEARDLVFERFYRVDPSRHREKDRNGTGLGLAIVKEIVERFGGQVGLHSDGNLHNFWVTLPLEIKTVKVVKNHDGAPV